MLTSINLPFPDAKNSDHILSRFWPVLKQIRRYSNQLNLWTTLAC